MYPPIPSISRSRAMQAQSRVTREDFTSRLGLPASASNEQVFAAITAIKQKQTPSAADDVLSEEAVYARVMGPMREPQPAPPLSEEALYAKVAGL